ncbi:hypothetical protein AB0K18_35650 [Nonomuraea sp. NPDC049421]|uniref:hypothetical protein n=1 Tax=Nonomuraea sp. NPDC049421 TaxID=3155275 RepID=UPI003448143D
MNTWATFLIAVAAAFALGRYGQAAKEAHGKYLTYRSRMVSGFTTWVRNVVVIASLCVGVVLGIVLLIRWS